VVSGVEWLLIDKIDQYGVKFLKLMIASDIPTAKWAQLIDWVD